MVDPCTLEQFTINDTVFPSSTTVYYSEDQTELDWDKTGIATHANQLECGEIQVTIFNSDDSTIDATFFDDSRNLSETANTFIIKKFTDPNLIETKKLKYNVCFEDAPLNCQESSEFEVVYANPCAQPTSFSAESIDDATNNYDGFEVEFEVQDYNVVPADCKIVYECDSIQYTGFSTESDILSCEDLDLSGAIAGQPGQSKLSITPSQAQYLDRTLPPGEYDITITGRVKDATDQTAFTKPTTFKLTLVDPCNPP